MRDYHGIIFAYHEEPALRDLTANRTAASLPFCGRLVHCERRSALGFLGKE